MNAGNPRILDVQQTPYLKGRGEGGLLQLLRVRVSVPRTCEVTLRLDGESVYSESVEAGERQLSIYRPEPREARASTLVLTTDGAEVEFAFRTLVPKHLSVHVVQLSHHDLGYTDIPSRVLADHDRWLGELLDMADALEDRTGDERLRVVFEQGWSIDHFLKTASPADRERMLWRIRQGDFELTALYGNQITEIMGHEEMYRLFYPAARIAKEAGVPIVSAEHNDITGISWGLCRALCDAGVKIFCPGIPLYYAWGGRRIPSFWEERRVFDAAGPGAFWWESPDGKRVLFWCNNSGCGGDNSGSLEGLREKIDWLMERDWPYEVLRWPVGGANRDNAPFISKWSDAARKWNRQWAYPRVICSTNARFYEEFIARLDRELPVHRGDLPGQDYPPGAMSLPEATIAARGAQRTLQVAETLHSLVCAGLAAPGLNECIREAYQNLLRSDEHAYGYHFPAGYAMRAGQLEKRVYGARAEAFADEIAQKSLSVLSDNAEGMGDVVRLLVYNPGEGGDLSVETPMREFDNTGSRIMKDNRSDSLRGYLLHQRMHVNPDAELALGRFELVEIESGEKEPFQIDTIAPDSPEPFAPERYGLSEGTRRYGFFEEPIGLKKTLRFVAKDMPAFGYRSYALVPVQTAGPGPAVAESSIENEAYRIRWDENGVCSVTERASGRELLDESCPYRLGQVLVRHGNDLQAQPMEISSIHAEVGGVASSLTIRGSARGVPSITVVYRLWRGLRRIDIAARILRDGTPMFNAHMAFPFRGKGFRYEGPLCELVPVDDFLPGAQSDALGVRDWVRIGGTDLRFESLDSPIVSLGALHPGYVSPAHRAMMPEEVHETLTEADYRGGLIYSMLYSNNYGTNWAVSGSGETLYRYRIGEDAADAMTIFSDRTTGRLPASGGLLKVEGAQLIALKRAEDQNGYVARLWNRTARQARVKIEILGRGVRIIERLDAAERPLGLDGETIAIKPDEVQTWRIAF